MIKIYESRAFQAAVVQSGWDKSGIWPYNRIKLLSSCESFQKAYQDTQALPIINAIPILVAKSKVSGICEEADLDEHIGSIDNGFFKTPIENMADRTMNQQRALWLNKQGVLDKRAIDKARKDAADALAKQKKDAASKNKADRLALEQAQLQPIDEARTGPPPIGTYCEGGCKKSQSSIESPCNDWFGCNGLANCGKWYCPLKGCKTKLDKHRIICCARRVANDAR